MKEALLDNMKKIHANVWIACAAFVFTLSALLMYQEKMYQEKIARTEQTDWIIAILGAAGLLGVAGLVSAAVLVGRLAVLLGLSRDLIDSWQKSSGLHHWTELPKGKRFLVVTRTDCHRTTVLGVGGVYFKTAEVVSPCWFVQFDVPLPPEVQAESHAIILDSEDELLHKDAEKVHLLLTSYLTPQRDDRQHPLPGVAPAFHQVGSF